MSTQKVKQIIDTPVCKGELTKIDDNQFTGYTAPVNRLSTIQDMYLKMKLCNPKAKHVICAYYLPGEDTLSCRGYCDDGEHGAGSKLLKLLIENDLQNWVVFVTRVYGNKLGSSRHRYILEAALKCLEMYPENEYQDEFQHVNPETIDVILSFKPNIRVEQFEEESQVGSHSETANKLQGYKTRQSYRDATRRGYRGRGTYRGQPHIRNESIRGARSTTQMKRPREESNSSPNSDYNQFRKISVLWPSRPQIQGKELLLCQIVKTLFPDCWNMQRGLSIWNVNAILLCHRLLIVILSIE